MNWIRQIVFRKSVPGITRALRDATRASRFTKSRLRYSLAACALLALTACGVAPPPANGWAIVAADPKTGDVGVAAASCSELPYDYRAALVPNLGTGAQLGVASPLHRDRLRAWIEHPYDAAKTLHLLTFEKLDPDAAKRQYGIITLHQGQVQLASYTGANSAPWAGDLQDANAGVVVAGSGLVNENVLRISLDAYRAPENAAMPLSDRLMRALEAGSAAGGISLCNQNGVAQTASTAFIMMARGGDPNFGVDTLGNTAAQEPNPPWLALSVTEPPGGRNALVDLVDRYNAWRQDNLPECPECVQARPVPRGGTLTVASDFILTHNAPGLVIAFVLVIMTGTIVYFVMRPRTGRSVHLNLGD